MDANQFSSEVKRRRNLFFAAAPSWFVITPTFIICGTMVLPFFVAGLLALATWMVLMHKLQKRVVDLKCFNCNRQAFDHAFFFMCHAKCKACGTAYAST